MQLWICGKNASPTNNVEWEFFGVFDTEEKAVAACTGPLFWVGPAVLNERLPDGPNDWPGGYYPLAPTPDE